MKELHVGHLVLIGAACSAASIIAMSLLQRRRRKGGGGGTEDTVEARSTDYPDELIREQLARNHAFLGEAGYQKVRSSSVIVVGLGGVGSWAATMLVRSGVKKIRVIDFDQVSLSSLNRHAVATLEDIGTSKVKCFQKHMVKIAPWVQIEAINELWTLENAEKLLQIDADFILDAIDNIDTKVDLLYYCVQNGLSVLSSMGSGCKSDPSRIFIADISQTDEDPLSRVIRRRLRIKGVEQGIPVVFSTEKPAPGKALLVPLNEEEFRQGQVEELGVLPNFRIRIMPVLGSMPGIFGLAMATHVLTTISNYPTEPISYKLRNKLYHQLHSAVRMKYGDNNQLSTVDIAYVLDEIYRGRSILSPRNYRNLTLCEWRLGGGLNFGNAVVLTKEEAETHLQLASKHQNKLGDMYDRDTINRVEARLREEIYFNQYRI